MSKKWEEPIKKLYHEHLLLAICGLISLIFLSFFFVLQYKGNSILDLNTRWILVSGIPILIGLLAGGYIKKFKLFEMELESKLNTPVSSLQMKATDVMISQPGSEKESTTRLPDFTEDKIELTTRLSFISGRRNYYGTNAVRRYLEHLRKLEYLEVKRESGEFVCLIPISEFKSNNANNRIDGLSTSEIDRFVEALGNGNVPAMYSDSCIQLTVGQDEGLLEVLQKMRDLNTKAAVVVDTKKRFIGLLTNSEIEHRIANDVLYSKREQEN